MSDLISRKAVLDALEESGHCYHFWIDIENIIESLPSADRPTGDWVYNPNGYDYGLPAWECDQCGCINANIPPSIMTKDGKPNYAPINPNAFSGSNFCPNCGAKMGGDNDGNDLRDQQP